MAWRDQWNNPRFSQSQEELCGIRTNCPGSQGEGLRGREQVSYPYFPHSLTLTSFYPTGLEGIPDRYRGRYPPGVVSVMSEYPQDGGSVCCSYHYHVDSWLQNCVVRCILHAIGCHNVWRMSRRARVPKRWWPREKGWWPLSVIAHCTITCTFI